MTVKNTSMSSKYGYPLPGFSFDEEPSLEDDETFTLEKGFKSEGDTKGKEKEKAVNKRKTEKNSFYPVENLSFSGDFDSPENKNIPEDDFDDGSFEEEINLDDMMRSCEKKKDISNQVELFMKGGSNISGNVKKNNQRRKKNNENVNMRNDMLNCGFGPLLALMGNNLLNDDDLKLDSSIDDEIFSDDDYVVNDGEILEDDDIEKIEEEMEKNIFLTVSEKKNILDVLGLDSKIIPILEQDPEKDLKIDVGETEKEFKERKNLYKDICSTKYSHLADLYSKVITRSSREGAVLPDDIVSSVKLILTEVSKKRS